MLFLLDVRSRKIISFTFKGILKMKIESEVAAAAEYNVFKSTWLKNLFYKSAKVL